jgi:glycerol-3-phosphate acyltransferase PlsX
LARIALDAMGGDYAPQAPVTGTLLALREFGGDHTFQLIGQSAVVSKVLEELLAGDFADVAERARASIEIIEAPDVVSMSDKPAAALRGKPNSSMIVGLRRHAEGLADAFVSAGNTGAQMAASTVILKLHEGLRRPAIGTLFPSALDPVLVLDSGANVDCSPDEYVQFARLGSVYAETILGRKNPSIGLLSIGEEAEKGNAVVKEANRLLSTTSGINFQGNVEGRDIPAGASDRGPIDIVVCDGFVGNVLLKFYEAAAPLIVGLVGRHAGLDREQLEQAFGHLDYSEYGGAPLLGVKGVSIISHGKSSPRALKNAIRVGIRAVESRMSEHMGSRLAPVQQTAALGESA